MCLSAEGLKCVYKDNSYGKDLPAQTVHLPDIILFLYEKSLYQEAVHVLHSMRYAFMS